MVGQLVAIPFRGTGWVYLGETDSRKGIAYDSRRLDPEGQSFIFRTEAAGEYALKFYRQDFIRDFILNDYVQVIVGDPPETGWNPLIDRGRVVAEPRWPTSLEEARVLRGDTQPRDAAPAAPAPAPAPVRPPAQTAQQPPAQPPSAQPPQTPPQPRPQTPPPATPSPEQAPPEQPPLQIPDLEPDEYLKRAKEEFDAGRIAAAIAYLDRYHEFYPMDSDEVLWLYGQFYEANSPSRNILAALDCYRRLTREYPQSSRFDDARRRIAYLQRFYINIQ
jgi:tetratricopeptide (TPR) repeat protein